MAEIPEVAHRARQLYADGVDTRTIMAETKLTLHGFYNWLDGRAQKNGPQVLPPLPRRKVLRRARISPGDRISLIERVMRSSEQQVADIEKRIGAGDSRGEKDARTLALISRTIRELTATDALNRSLEQPPAMRGKRRAKHDDDQPPDDIDEFRNELARRIDALIASEADAKAAGEP